MKQQITKFAAFVIGIVYLLSGISKWIDNASTSLKVNEYAMGFNIEVSPIIIDSTSIVLVYTEILIGLCIHINCFKKIALQLAFIMTGIFGIITLLAATSSTMNECGCFGSFLHLTLWQSFTKNILLLIISGIALLSHKLSNLHSKKTILIVCLSSVLILYGMVFCQPLHNTNNIKIYSKLSKTENGKYKVPIEITLEGEDVELNQIKDTTIFVVIRKPYKLSSKQISNIINTTAHISIDKPFYIITTKENYVNTPYQNFKIAYTDNHTLEELIQFNIGIIAISNGILIGKWQQNALRTQKEPQTLADIIP